MSGECNLSLKKKKKIIDKKQFLNDILNKKKKEIISIYKMGGATINRRINELLGRYGIKNYGEAKKFLKNKNITEILNEINN